MISISEIDSSSLGSEAAFVGVECMRCHSDDIKTDYFLVTPSPETDDDYVELEEVVKKQCGRDSFSEMCCDLGTVIILSRCTQCGSDDIFEDL